jgi:DNA-binding CsgD family transcriptional regulator
VDAQRGRDAYARGAWAEAYEAFAAADARAPLGPLDREQLALAAFLTGHDEAADAARERAHHDHLAAGDAESAARCAFWLALALVLRGEAARGGGWFGLAHRVLAEAGLDDSVWHGYLLVPAGVMAIFGGDPAAALATFEAAAAFVDRHDDPDLRTLVRHGHGQALVAAGEIAAGLAEIDEVMVSVTTSGAISPHVVGLIYCAAIETCRDCFDVRRGREWTDALSRWCAAQPDLVPYRGQCLVHRAEILQLHGSWPDAMEEVRRACERFEAGPADAAAGMAHYQRGELHRLRGEEAAAEEAYRAASRCGHDPQPGLALLRLMQGQTAAAAGAIRRAAEEGPQLRLLPAYVEIALAAGDLTEARTAANQLGAAVAGLAGSAGPHLLTGAALRADGAVRLAEGDAAGALPVLRRAWTAYQDIAAPYDAARTRVLVGLACRALGDADTAEMELDAARWVFEQLGAAPDVARVRELARHGRPAAAPGGLTLREVQVLRLVATGATNRGIAKELFLSESTVARHVANIFTKLGLSSRSAATAFAYENNLV